MLIVLTLKCVYITNTSYQWLIECLVTFSWNSTIIILIYLFALPCKFFSKRYEVKNWLFISTHLLSLKFVTSTYSALWNTWNSPQTSWWLWGENEAFSFFYSLFRCLISTSNIVGQMYNPVLKKTKLLLFDRFMRSLEFGSFMQ